MVSAGLMMRGNSRSLSLYRVCSLRRPARVGLPMVGGRPAIGQFGRRAASGADARPDVAGWCELRTEGTCAAADHAGDQNCGQLRDFVSCRQSRHLVQDAGCVLSSAQRVNSAHHEKFEWLRGTSYKRAHATRATYACELVWQLLTLAGSADILALHCEVVALSASSAHVKISTMTSPSYH